MKNLYVLGLSLAAVSFASSLAFGQTPLSPTPQNAQAERQKVSLDISEFQNISEVQDISMFPSPDKGQKQFRITLPPQTDEYAFRLGLIIGRMEETDGVNHFGLSGQIVEKDLQGWGYPYYEVEGSEGPGFSTLMAAPPGSPKVTQFVTLQEKLIRYNSRLPIVIYAPESYEVRYRIYSAGPIQSAKSVANPGAKSTTDSVTPSIPTGELDSKFDLVTFEVGPNLVNCHGPFPQKCLIVNGEYFYDQIEGFEPQKDYISLIEVERHQRCDPNVINSCPQDVGIYTYRLKRILSKRPAR